MQLHAGKPGYDKTILCSRIVEDLHHRIAANFSTGKGLKTSTVVYFYFSKLQCTSNTGMAAFRAILAQILQVYHSNAAFVDAAAILHEGGLGQTHASEREVRDILHLFLALMGPSYLIFDGLDECTDEDEFAQLVLDTIDTSDSKVLILSRPSLYLPSLRHACCPVYHIGLENKRNQPAIEHNRITELVKYGTIQDDFDLNDTVSQLSSRANSIFLWAVLMCNYLSLPYLITAERLDAIHRLNHFEGLDAMYLRILEEL